MQLPNQQKSFPECFAPFLKSTSNFLIFSKKRWPSQLLYSWNYRLSITWLDKYLKSPVSEHRFSVNMLKDPKGCWNLHGGTLKIPLLVILENLRCVNKLTADDEYSLRKSKNLPQPLQLQLSKKPKVFSKLLLRFWNLHQLSNILRKGWPS